MPDKIFGWFDQRNREQLDRLIREHDVKTVLEIGSFLGLSAAWFAERVEYVTCVDTFEETATESSDNNLVWTLKDLHLPNPFRCVFDCNMDAVGVTDKVSVIQKRSADAAMHVGRFDLIYIDGDHSYEGITSDIVLYLPKARKVICGDDYTRRFPGILKATEELLPGHQSICPFWWKVVDRSGTGLERRDGNIIGSHAVLSLKDGQ